jgi:hypothetical protein
VRILKMNLKMILNLMKNSLMEYNFRLNRMMNCAKVCSFRLIVKELVNCCVVELSMYWNAKVV